MLKRFISLFLCITMVFLLCSCKNSLKDNSTTDNDSEVNEETYEMQLLCSFTDTFNPYTLTSEVNFELSSLLYEPLIKLNNNFEPQYALAVSSNQDGAVWTLQIADATFTDGTSVTAEDVIYSFNLAKTHSRYESALSEVSNISGSGKNVVFTLSRIDKYFLNLLTFPIIKAYSDTLKTSDDVEIPPIGAGRFLFSEDGTYLLRNENYYADKGHVIKINLVNSPDSESVAHHVEVGAADIYYANLNDGKIIRMSGKKATVNQNNLVYLGMNLSNSMLSDIYLRYAISTAINRDKISLTAYYGNAVSATGPLHPCFKDIGSSQTTQTVANTQIAIENLEKIGYNRLDSEGYRLNSSGKRLTLNLLVNEDNQSRVTAAELISSQLKAVGIKINIVKLPYESYVASLTSGQFQLYIAEVKINNNFDVSSLVIPGGSAAYGITASAAENAADDTLEDEAENSNETNSQSNISGVIDNFYSGNGDITDVITAIQSQMLIIPICYRTGILFYSENISDITDVSVTDLFLSINSIKMIS